jgi:hypothetical protein
MDSLFTHVTTEWVSRHLDNNLTKVDMSYMSILQSAVKEEDIFKDPHDPRIKTKFMQTVGSIKYKWDWVSEETKQQILRRIQDVLRVINSDTKVTYKVSHLKEFRNFLTEKGWVLL